MEYKTEQQRGNYDRVYQRGTCGDTSRKCDFGCPWNRISYLYIGKRVGAADENGQSGEASHLFSRKRGCDAPKAALGILTAFSADDLRFAVLSEDAKTIAKAPGIGVKTAKKMILELKDKLDLEDAFEKKLLHEQEAEETLPDARGEAVEALTALGYSPADALRAVQKVEPGDDMDTEAILKAALKRMI